MDTRRMVVYSHDDQFLFEIPRRALRACTMREAINGEHSLSFEVPFEVDKECRIITQDATGKVREHVVMGSDAVHRRGEVTTYAHTCVWSLQHDLYGVTTRTMPGTQSPCTASTALDSLLSHTDRWSRGTVTVATTGGASMWYMNGWEAMRVLVGVWGGEVDADITIDANGVVSRQVSLYAAQGNQTALRRFDWSRDLTEIDRKVADTPVYCQIIPRGKGEQTETGGYGRKIDITSVNGNVEYLRNENTAPLYRLPTSNGWEYTECIVENGEIEDPQELKEWGLSVLGEYTEPKVTYVGTVFQYAEAGMDPRGIELGDKVQMVDRDFSEDGLRLEGRVQVRVIDMLDPSTAQLTIGNVSGGLTSMLSTVNKLTDAVQGILGGPLTSDDYLDRLVQRLNGEINALGGYWYVIPGLGTRTYDTEVSDPAVGAEASKVVEIKGGAMRIADSRTAQGDWDWKSVFVSGHIAAELVTVANIVAGFIGNANGDFYINFDTHEYRLGAGAYIGNKTVQQVLSTVDATITDVDVEYAQNQSTTTAPTSGWSTTAPAWQSGYYIWQRTKTTSAGGVVYSEPTCISGRDGTNGTNGTNGRGVTTTTISYGVSDSASVQPTSWSGTSPTSIANGKWLWVRTVMTYSDGTDTTSYQKSYVGTNGADGTSVSILGSYNTLAELQQAHPTGSAGDSYIVAGDLYVWNGSSWEDVGTIQGPAGANGTSVSVASIQYATSTTETQPSTGWSSTAPSTVAEGSWLWVKTTYTDGTYAVTRSKQGKSGTNGTNGADGTSVTVSKIEYGETTSATTEPSYWYVTTPTVIGQGKWLWVKTTYSDGSTALTKSYVGTDGEDGTSVTIQSATKTGDTTRVVITDGTTTSTLTIVDGEDGSNGTNGASGYVHTAWANSADGQTDFSTTQSSGKRYLGVYTDHTAADSTSPSAYSWSLIKGADGTSVTISKIEYGVSSNASSQPSSWSQTVPTSVAQGNWLWVKTTYSSGNTATTKSYIGTDGEDGKSVYVQSSTKSGDTTRVVLSDGTTTSTIVIKDGEDGANGTNGTNGLTGYVHTAWANSANGSVDFSTTVSANKKYLGVYTDNTAADSTNYTKYSWSLIKGADGQDGADGADGTGIVSIVEQYYLSTSTVSQTGGSWSTSQPAWQSGRYIWTRSAITWDTSPQTTTYTTPVLAKAINGANTSAANAQSTANSAQNTATSARNTADGVKSDFDVLNTQQGVFNKLTNNGALQGLYMLNGNLYVNGTYIRGGTIVAGGQNNVNGTFQVQDASGNVIGEFDKDGIELTGNVHMIHSGSSGALVHAELGDYQYRTEAGVTVTITGLNIYHDSSVSYPNYFRVNPNWAYNVSTHQRTSAIQTKGPLVLHADEDLGYNYIGEINVNSSQTEIECGTSSDQLTAWFRKDRVSFARSGRGQGAIFTLSGSERDSQLYVDGKVKAYELQITSTKSRVAETESYGSRALYSYETPTPLFGDVGSSTIGEDGAAYVSIDGMFAETARTDVSYQVFLQKCGSGDLWVEEKASTHFVVRGTPGLGFDWEIKARQTGYDGLRLEDADLQEKTSENADTIALETAMSYDDEAWDDGLFYDLYSEELGGTYEAA